MQASKNVFPGNAWGKGNGFWAFFRTYILKRGFLDGQQGFMLAISNAEGSYYRYVKLMYLQDKFQK